jgi:hypothetical protein
MLPLLLMGVVFAFLVVGALVFVFCGLVPPLRKYGLSAALWCAMWGPSLVAWLLLAGLGLVANGFAMRVAQTRRIHLPDLPHNIGTGYAVLGIIGAILLATIIAWIHQVVIRQMTFALFRIYAGLISAGVGSVWGWCLWIWLVLDTQIPYRVLLWGIGMVGFCVAFGYAGLHWAKNLRSDTTTRFGLVSQQEFEGTI